MKWVEKEIESRLYDLIDKYIKKGIPLRNIKNFFRHRKNILLDNFMDLKHHFDDIKTFNKTIFDIFNVVIKDLIYEERDNFKK
jgi:hypothetical protein